MRSKVAEAARRMQIEADLRLTPAQRVARARALGEEQLRVLMAAQRISRAEALRIVAIGRKRGRER
jgi:hypothetical protein